jgi:hypothetical protein
VQDVGEIPPGLGQDGGSQQGEQFAGGERDELRFRAGGDDCAAAGLEVTAIDGTTMELARNGVLEDGFGTPAEGARPLLRVTAHVRTATFRWIGAAIGGYHDGENALADQLEDSFTPGILNLVDRGFFSMHRWIRFSGTGADLAGFQNSAAAPDLGFMPLARIR